MPPTSVPALRIRRVRAWAALLATLLSPIVAEGQADSPAPSLTVLSRSIVLERTPLQAWRVDYRLRNDGETPLVLPPTDLVAQVDGFVSNSRIPGLASPRRSSLSISGSNGLTACSEVIPSADEDRRCRERGLLQVWPAELGDEPPGAMAKVGAGVVSPADLPTWTIPVGGVIRVRLKLEHVQFLYGPHDPLLGRRTLELHLGASSIPDVLVLDRDRRRSSTGPPSLPTPPADRLDRRVFVSAPDSLHLEAHVPGNQYYRFERPVRYGTRMRLRYWYLVAPGTEGECRAQVRQFRDASVWRVLSDGQIEQPLPVVGRWVRVERIFRTEAEATHLSLEFRITGAGDVGEMWVDDVTLESLDEAPAGP